MPELVPIEGYPGYAVSRDGKVWTSWIPTGKGKAHVIGDGAWKEMRPSPHRGGYRTVHLKTPIRYDQKLVHVLVLEAFVGPCPKGHKTVHLDGVKKNNALENLKWAPRSEKIFSPMTTETWSVTYKISSID